MKQAPNAALLDLFVGFGHSPAAGAALAPTVENFASRLRGTY
jgi:hypothetical protein